MQQKMSKALLNRNSKIENMIRHAQIIEDNGAKNEIQLVNSYFTEILGDEESYKIVGSAEADPFEGKISNESQLLKH